MASSMKFEFKTEGFREILHSPILESQLQSVGERIAREAASGITRESKGFSVHTWNGNYGGGRVVASVTSADIAASIAEQQDKVLSSAVH